MNDLIKNRILELTPDIKESSLKTFVSNLYNLHKNYATSGENNLEWFLNEPLMLELIADRPISSQKNILASILRLFPDASSYRDRMYKLGEKIKANMSSNQKTEKQEQGWKTEDELQAIFDSLYSKNKSSLLSKTPLMGRILSELSDFILFCLASGLFIPPRRSIDLAELKHKNYTPEDNYIKNGVLVYNKYKTAGVYGTQKVAIPKLLKSILTKYMKLNPYDYLLVNNHGEPLSNSRITQKLNALTGSKTSTSMLRHIYLSSVYKDIPALNELNQIANDMGHSVSTAMEYAKK